MFHRMVENCWRDGVHRCFGRDKFTWWRKDEASLCEVTKENVNSLWAKSVEERTRFAWPSQARCLVTDLLGNVVFSLPKGLKEANLKQGFKQPEEARAAVRTFLLCFNRLRASNPEGLSCFSSSLMRDICGHVTRGWRTCVSIGMQPAAVGEGCRFCLIEARVVAPRYDVVYRVSRKIVWGDDDEVAVSLAKKTYVDLGLSVWSDDTLKSMGWSAETCEKFSDEELSKLWRGVDDTLAASANGGPLLCTVTLMRRVGSIAEVRLPIYRLPLNTPEAHFGFQTSVL